IILYQFLTGQKPFSGEGAWTVAKKIVQEDPPMPSSINVALSPEFDRVVAKALAKDPDQRFATAREFSQALKRAAEGKPAVQEVEPTLVVPRESRVPQATHPEALRSGEMELEFWRSIKDSDDPNDFELYVRQFPQGVYASLAARKAAKLRSGSPADDSGTRTMAGADRTRLQRSAPRAEGEARARAPGGKTIKLTEAQVQRADELKAKREAETQRAAEAQAKREAEAKAKREAAAQAKRETEAKAQREAEEKAQREAKATAQRDAESKAKLAAETSL